MEKFLLVGNPNTGKTTLLNTLTKSEEHTGNWHGVTVEEKEKNFSHNGKEFTLVDLPGIYSLNAFSYEEEVSIKYIFSNQDKVIVNTLDINTLQKNLFLTLDLLLSNLDVILVVNTMGKKDCKQEDFQDLKNALGVEILAVDFENKNEVKQLKSFLSQYKKKIQKINISKKIFSQGIYEDIKILSKEFKCDFFETLKILEKNNYFIKKNAKIIEKNNIFDKYSNINMQTLAQEKYAFIEKITKSIFENNNKRTAYGEEFLDKILLNKWLAIPLFFLILIGIFYLTFFSIGAMFSDLLADLFQVKIGGVVIAWLDGVCNIPWIIGLVENGVFSGVGSLVSFLPQVVLLFLFLAILENTGYFSRVAFIFDDLFSVLGLSGKSVYTLLMGFGCSASAVLTARALDSKSAQIKTTLMTPYMSCSAKLPVYAILGGAFFGASNVFVIFLLYIISVFVAIFVGMLLDVFGFKNTKSIFLMEFTPYRFPNFVKVCKIAWVNLKLFVVKITTIFISMSVIVWCLGSFDFAFNYVVENGGKSMLQIMGEWLAPLFAPLGFASWGAVGALVAGIVAKEVIVSSIAIFNGITAFGNTANNMIADSVRDSASAVHFSSAGALSFLSYSLLYTPCLATMAVMKKEIGLKWTLIGILIQLCVAYVFAFIVFNVYRLMEIVGVWNVLFIVLAILGILISIFRVFSYLKMKNKCKLCGLCKR